ncbi:AAA family ATPase [Hyphococcus formosus]|uniref:AAA family ATPase n=1 Tax=Hyphococcus formosus TaxID=3143534 RepID=UPI00398B72CB
MRLRSVSISNYKNLRDFSIDFAGEEFIDIFVGKNGSGKSNFLEALIEIFDHLYTFNAKGVGPGFNYTIRWSIEGTDTELSWEGAPPPDSDAFSIKVGGKSYKTLRKATLPKNIIVYYSGQNDNVAALVRRYVDSYRQSVKKANVARIPEFINIGPDYKALLLAIMLMMPEVTRARQFLCSKLGIESVGQKTGLTLHRPGKGIVNQKRAFDPFEADELFWGVKGVAREFLDRLMACITGEFTPGSLYDRETQTYRLQIDVNRFREEFADTTPDEVFCQFNALHTLGMIENVAIPVRLGNQVEVTSRAFSDGQFQSIYLFAISELFKNRECLTLLDEPDAFLHPEWQHDFLNQVLQISEEAAKTNHILMSSHSASTIAAKVDTRLRVFEVNGQAVAPAERDKGEIIGSLSAGLISYSEAEAQLNILHALENTEGPVVFTEGVTDEVILEIAWKKLFGDRQRPFEIQGTFGCGFLGALLREESIYNDHPDRKFFGVFDFDEAYNNWNSNNTEFIQQDVARGLVRRKQNHPGFFILLPVPPALTVRTQVINPQTGEHYRERSALPIEMLFHDTPGLEEHFCDDQSRPGNIRKLACKKTVFARQIVPEIDAAHFECFRPLFEFIETQIVAEIADGEL